MKELDVKSAYEQKNIKTLNLQDESEAMNFLDKAYKLYSDRSKWLSVEKRISILNKAASIARSKREDLALTAAKEGGKPLKDSLVEIDRAIHGIELAANEVGVIKGNVIPMAINDKSMGHQAFTRKEPRGVVFAISAFNHPFNLIVHQAVTAVAACCPVIVKPALDTPLSCINLAEILYEAGLDKRYLQVLLCENDVAEKIVGNSKISFLTFIGSEKVGWYLRSKLSKGAACALEHGGVAPAIIDKSANISKAIPLLIKGGFYHAGQVCVSTQRIFIDNKIKSQFVEGFLEEVKNLKVGNPEEKDVDVGPLIRPKEVDRIDTWVSEAVNEGATLLCGGKKISETCYMPTVLLNPSFSSKVSKEEVFGPVVCLYTYDDINQAINDANNVDYAFQASLFSNDMNQVLKYGPKIECKTLLINQHTAFRVDWMPFGGYKKSGLGTGSISHTINDMLIEKQTIYHQIEN